MSVLQKTIAELTALAARRPAIAVGYSGGKDSLVVIDLCTKIFSSVRPFFFYTAPDLEVCEFYMRFARERWGLEVARIPHWRRLMAMKEGLWCDATDALDKLPDLGLKDAFAYAMQVVGAEAMVTGMKDADGLPRRQFFENISRHDKANFWGGRVFHPIRDWSKKDVLDYLRVSNIPLPDCNEGAVTSGVGLDHDSLCWLHDKHPEDFQKLLKWYPYAEAAIKRREWFGVT